MKIQNFLTSILGCFVVGISTTLAMPALVSNDTITYPVNPAQTNEVFAYVDEQPEYPTGREAFHQYLKNNLIYPQEALNKGIQGTMYVTFIVEKDGSISNPETLGELGYGCNEESLRLIKSMPKWIPGRKNGFEVRVKMTVPINFFLPEKKVDSQNKFYPFCTQVKRLFKKAHFLSSLVVIAKQSICISVDCFVVPPRNDVLFSLF